MEYREQLPDGCPPDDSDIISSRQEVFRLVRNTPPTEDDFTSQRAEYPTRNFHGVSECQARGLSVHTKLDDSLITLKLPSMRGRSICRVSLDIGSGAIMKTGRGSHHTWWPLASYDILNCCEIVNT